MYKSIIKEDDSATKDADEKFTSRKRFVLNKRKRQK
jgi:hypothetical protein